MPISLSIRDPVDNWSFPVRRVICPIGRPSRAGGLWKRSRRDRKIHLEVDDDVCLPGEEYREGIITDTDGTPTIVVWVKYESTSPVFFRIKMLEP